MPRCWYYTFEECNESLGGLKTEFQSALKGVDVPFDLTRIIDDNPPDLRIPEGRLLEAKVQLRKGAEEFCASLCRSFELCSDMIRYVLKEWDVEMAEENAGTKRDAYFTRVGKLFDQLEDYIFDAEACQERAKLIDQELMPLISEHHDAKLMAMLSR